MWIEKIEAVTKDRCRLTLDTGERFILYKGELRTLRIKEDSELTDEKYNQITKGILPKRAKLRVMNLLKTKSYTEYQLRCKLKEAEYREDIIDQALEYVKSFHYVDDKQYAIDYINELSESKSKKEIYQKLQVKGIKRDVLDQAFKELYGQFEDAIEKSTFNESAIIEKALRKKGFTGNETYEEKQKILAYFYRRGFDMDAVYTAMDLAKQ